MDFILSEEQRMLDDSLRRLMADRWTFTDRRRRHAAGRLDTGAWAALVDLGVLGLTIPVDYEGFGEDPASLLPVHRALGAALVSEPVIVSGVVAATVLHTAAEDATNPNRVEAQAAARRLLPAIGNGSTVATLAYQEIGRRYSRDARKVIAERDGDGYRFSGTKTLVWHGGAATAWLVNAALADGSQGLFLVEGGDIAIDDMPTIDHSRCATLVLDGVRLPASALIAREAAASRALDTALDWGVAALCAHAVGAMESLVAMTAEYLNTREQFGQPLARFQALQHRLAEMVVAREMALSMAYVAVAALTEDDPRLRRQRVALAKLEVGRRGREIGQHAVQLHGGMGMTDELPVGDYFKRLVAIDLLWGDAQDQIGTLGDML